MRLPHISSHPPHTLHAIICKHATDDDIFVYICLSITTMRTIKFNDCCFTFRFTTLIMWMYLQNLHHRTLLLLLYLCCLCVLFALVCFWFLAACSLNYTLPSCVYSGACFAFASIHICCCSYLRGKDARMWKCVFVGAVGLMNFGKAPDPPVDAPNGGMCIFDACLGLLFFFCINLSRMHAAHIMQRGASRVNCESTSKYFHAAYFFEVYRKHHIFF